MLKSDIDSSLVSEWLHSIKEHDCKEAFLYLIGLAAASSKYICHPQKKGYLRDFRFHRSDSSQPYSFITNQKWLLFYFRKPSFTDSSVKTSTIRSYFPEAGERKSGEIKVKLFNVSDIERLQKIIQF